MAVPDDQVLDEYTDEPCDNIDPSPRNDDSTPTDLDSMLGHYFWAVPEQREVYRIGLERVLTEYDRDPNNQNNKISDAQLLIWLREEERRDWFIREYFPELDEEQREVFRMFLDMGMEKIIRVGFWYVRWMW